MGAWFGAGSSNDNVYEILGELGRGGYGITYQVFDKINKKMYA
jgi:hypothetical protein